jgi:hypothetical protein
VVAVAVVGNVVVNAVDAEGDGRDSQAGEGALEAVEAGELALVAPGLSVGLSAGVGLVGRVGQDWGLRLGGGRDSRPLPGVVSGLAGRGPQGADVEAGDVGLLALGGKS